MFDYIKPFQKEYLYFRKDRDLISNIILAFSHFLNNYMPRFLYTFVETFIGIDDTKKIDFKVFPIVINNNLGGTSMQDVLHWR